MEKVSAVNPCMVLLIRTLQRVLVTLSLWTILAGLHGRNWQKTELTFYLALQLSKMWMSGPNYTDYENETSLDTYDMFLFSSIV